MRSAFLLLSIPLVGCASTIHRNTPLEAAEGSMESAGFGRTTTSTQTSNFLAEEVRLVTRVGQAASVVEGPRGDRLWRLSEDGLTLQHCRLLDERPWDCDLVPLEGGAYQPTIIDPTNLGGSGFFAAGNDWAMASGGTEKPSSLPATPSFGIWVSSVPRLVVPMAFGGTIVLGGALSFCHVHADEGARCIATKVVSSEVVGTFVLRSEGKLKHVIWAQPVGEHTLARCEADDATGEVVCKKTTKEL
jgi:hypothetical protein